LNEIDIIYQCQANNRNAQAELYQLYKDRLFALSLKYCKNTSDAEDVLQDSFITIFSRIQQYKARGSFEGWLKRITINKAIDKYHENKVKFLTVIEARVEDVNIDPDLIRNYSLDVLLQFIQELPNRYRLVFNLYEMDGYSHQEIAEMMKISIGTSKSNLHRAKLKLKKSLTKYSKTQQYG